MAVLNNGLTTNPVWGQLGWVYCHTQTKVLELKTMGRMRKPDPILDVKEQAQLVILTEKYEKLLKGGFLTKTGKKIKDAIPDPIIEKFNELGGKISSAELIQKALEHAGHGYLRVANATARFLTSPDSVVKSLQNNHPDLHSFEYIPYLRTYDLNRNLDRAYFRNLSAAALEGAATGYFGPSGIAPSLVLSTLLYLRVVQSVGIHYGYPVKDSVEEMEFAMEVLMFCFAPRETREANNMAALIGKLMAQSNLEILRRSLTRDTLTTMAQKGGLPLFYVQVRALAHKAADKALKNAGARDLEQHALKGLLQNIGQKLPKQVAGKAVPVLGAFLGAGIDARSMHLIFKRANLVYHKRALVEKEERIDLLER